MNTKRRVKNTRKRRVKNTRKRRVKHHLYRKQREIIGLPGSKGIPVFSPPAVKKNNKIHIVTNNSITGNMIPGLRNM